MLGLLTLSVSKSSVEGRLLTCLLIICSLVICSLVIWNVVFCSLTICEDIIILLSLLSVAKYETRWSGLVGCKAGGWSIGLFIEGWWYWPVTVLKAVLRILGALLLWLGPKAELALLLPINSHHCLLKICTYSCKRRRLILPTLPLLSIVLRLEAGCWAIFWLLICLSLWSSLR